MKKLETYFAEAMDGGFVLSLRDESHACSVVGSRRTTSSQLRRWRRLLSTSSA